MCIRIVGSGVFLPPLPTGCVTFGGDMIVGERGQDFTAADFSDAHTTMHGSSRKVELAAGVSMLEETLPVMTQGFLRCNGCWHRPKKFPT